MHKHISHIHSYTPSRRHYVFFYALLLCFGKKNISKFMGTKGRYNNMVYAFCILLVFAFAFYGFSFFCVLHLWNILVGDHRSLLKKLNGGDARNFFLSSFIVVWFLHGFFILFLIIFHCVVKGLFCFTHHIEKKVACLMIMWINWVFLQCPFICLLLHHFSYSAHMFNAFVLLTATTVLSPLNKLNENNEKNAKRVEINQKEWKVMRKYPETSIIQW